MFGINYCKTDCSEILKIGLNLLLDFKGHTIDYLQLNNPHDLEILKTYPKMISKLSPIIGNMIENAAVEKINEYNWTDLCYNIENCKWIRQDPNFPDALFNGPIYPTPGIEIKTWFPLSTEITARFKESVTYFEEDNTYLALMVWLPENILYGKPKIFDIFTCSCQSIAQARDAHYHDPPSYLIFEPEDTSARTGNLQQTNTVGYKFQGEQNQFEEAVKIVKSWGPNGDLYDPGTEYQNKLKDLKNRFNYRMDTNYSKLDRIEHEGLEIFKTKINDTKILGHTISDWALMIQKGDIDYKTLIRE